MYILSSLTPLSTPKQYRDFIITQNRFPKIEHFSNSLGVEGGGLVVHIYVIMHKSNLVT